MKKVIIKTAIITFISLIVLSGLVFGSLCLFAPSVMSDFYKDAGNEQKALVFAERAYEKNDSAANLQKVTDLAILNGDNQKIIEYGETLFDCAKNQEISLSVDYVYYVAGKIAISYCENRNYEKALTVAVTYSSGYGILNPIEMLISWGYEANDADFLQLVLNEIQTFNTDGLDASAKERLSTDVNNLIVLINNM